MKTKIGTEVDEVLAVCGRVRGTVSPSEWEKNHSKGKGRSSPRARGSSGLNEKVLYVRVTLEEHERFSEVAELRKVAVAEWARQVLRAAAGRGAQRGHEPELAVAPREATVEDEVARGYQDAALGNGGTVGDLLGSLSRSPVKEFQVNPEFVELKPRADGPSTMVVTGTVVRDPDGRAVGCRPDEVPRGTGDPDLDF